MSKVLKQIAVSEENYQALKQLGYTSDSFNDVITELLKQTRSGRDTGIVRAASSSRTGTLTC
jgi:predicted CopG family antitoxin